jgi:hypothetical protein
LFVLIYKKAIERSSERDIISYIIDIIKLSPPSSIFIPSLFVKYVYKRKEAVLAGRRSTEKLRIKVIRKSFIKPIFLESRILYLKVLKILPEREKIINSKIPFRVI